MKRIFLLMALFTGSLLFSLTAAAGTAHPLVYKDRQVAWETIPVPQSAHVFHFITHGRPGELLIEGQWRNAKQILAFIQYRQLLPATVRQLNIYGCEFAKGTKGRAAAAYLQQQLGIKLAASVNITGVSGDYFLETGNTDAACLFEGFTGNLQCAGVKGGRGPGDDLDGDGVCNDMDLDDDNDGVMDETEKKCSGSILNVNTYRHDTASSSITNLGNGTMVTTSFATIMGGGVSTDEPPGSTAGDLIYHFEPSQSDTAVYYYITEMSFDRPVRLLLAFPGVEAQGTHNSNDHISFMTPGSGTRFVVYNPDSAISILQNDPGVFRYHPNTVGNAEIPNINNRREYFVETRMPVTKVNIRVASSASDIINHVSVRVVIRACDTLDTDNDGIANEFDLDSDGDGCNDVYEAGVPGATKGSGNYTDTVAADPGSPNVGTNGYGDNLETYADSDTAYFTNNYLAYAKSASMSACMDGDDDGVVNRHDIDKDNDGILDAEEGGNCGNTGQPFTSLEQARASVEDPGIYHFNLSGKTFQTYVDTSGYILVAIDYGDGQGIMPYTTQLGFDKRTDGRGLLDTAALRVLGNIESIRITSGSQIQGGVDVVSTNDTLINRIKAGQSLHRGINDNSYNDDWTGKNESFFRNNATFNIVEPSDLRNVVVDVAGARPAFVWRSARNYQRVFWLGQEIFPNEYHALWVRGISTGTKCGIDTDTDGMLNHLDADSDGDGCSDASETNISGTLLPGMMVNNSGVIYSPKAIAEGPYGDNGFANPLETSPGSGVYAGSYSGYSNALDNAAASCIESPRLRPDANTTYAGIAISGDVSTNDSLVTSTVYNSATTVPGYNNPSASTPAIDSNGTYTFTTATAGIYKFNIPVCPSARPAGCQQALLTIDVLDPEEENNKPLALPDLVLTRAGDSVTLKTLSNDWTGNNHTTLDPSSVSITRSPRRGRALVIAPSSDITYIPDEGFMGQDTLTYMVCDDRSPMPNCNTGYQIITVLPSSASHAVVASDDYLLVPRNNDGFGNVAENDYDPHGDSITVVAQNRTVPDVGTFMLRSDGSYTFSPVSEFFGAVNFPYELVDHVSPETRSKATLYVLVSRAVPLPLDLLTFTAANENDVAVLLRWTTTNEINSSHFVIERMLNANGQWQPIGTVNTTGNGNTSVNSYYFRDEDPGAGANYYRLKQTDLDGSYEYSSVRLVSFAGNKENALLYPNPAKDYAIITGPGLQLSQLAVYDATGRQLDGIVQAQQISPQQIKLNVYRLKPGIYMLKINGQAMKLIKK